MGPSSRRVLMTSHRKNGAPMSAVTTPSRTSLKGEKRRSVTSAASTSAAPPKALAGKRRRGSWPTKRAQQMRNDEADETDGAGDGGRRADGERGAGDDARAQGFQVDAEVLRGLLAERERVERAPRRQQQRAAER